MAGNHQLSRTTFRTSRELDFFSEKTLISQTGHQRAEWPLVIVKELMDNALDAAEEAGVAPVVCVTADAEGIAVKDNGPGLPEKTLLGAMDFAVRVSSREAYVSPTRGAQGNALKTLLPMPFVLDRDQGRACVTTNGRRHDVRLGIDAVAQRVVLHHDAEPAEVAPGTEVRLCWSPRRVYGDEFGDGFIAWPFGNHSWPLSVTDQTAEKVRRLAEGFALFNPHAEIALDWFGHRTTWPATDPSWSKWKPSQPTSAHWYDLPRLGRLVGAYVTHDRDAGRDRLVSEFIAEFDGMSGSAKRTKVLHATGLKRAKLSELVAGDRLDTDKVARLLGAMRDATKPVKPDRLGVIGRDNLKARMLQVGAAEESFQYQCVRPDAGELPYVAEVAFGMLGDGMTGPRRIYAGANWSAAIHNPFRHFGGTGEGLETVLAKQRATADEPVVFVIHLACPRLEYTDAGKSAVVMGGPAGAAR